ncbi:hypothetical protein EVAR_27101_1 [Eumeta japonica]|uniref:Uncharacterized protein n=1 Tax=Eumeta variegata TaxID=151549 RepID=A0A4C1VKR6_EUMVA|nr:hypothetical protein EVAR_27101_1 [Eumeta japonica]
MIEFWFPIGHEPRPPSSTPLRLLYSTSSSSPFSLLPPQLPVHYFTLLYVKPLFPPSDIPFPLETSNSSGVTIAHGGTTPTYKKKDCETFPNECASVPCSKMDARKNVYVYL